MPGRELTIKKYNLDLYDPYEADGPTLLMVNLYCHILIMAIIILNMTGKKVLQT